MHVNITPEEMEESHRRLAEQLKRDMQEEKLYPWRQFKYPRQEYPADEICPDCQREHAKRTCPCCGKRFTATRPWMTLMAN